jgi:hypothetical protein
VNTNCILLDKKAIVQLFESSLSQYDVVASLYKMVYPDWDNIQYVDGYPKVNEKTSKYLFDKFIEFDRLHHPDVMHGGMWMNCGFGMLDTSVAAILDVGDFAVLPAPVVYHQPMMQLTC